MQNPSRRAFALWPDDVDCLQNVVMTFGYENHPVRAGPVAANLTTFDSHDVWSLRASDSSSTHHNFHLHDVRFPTASDSNSTYHCCQLHDARFLEASDSRSINRCVCQSWTSETNVPVRLLRQVLRHLPFSSGRFCLAWGDKDKGRFARRAGHREDRRQSKMRVRRQVWQDVSGIPFFCQTAVSA